MPDENKKLLAEAFFMATRPETPLQARKELFKGIQEADVR